MPLTCADEILGNHKVALVVGDVTGHSIHAAALMGQLRTTTAALARLGCPPEEIMAQLSGVVAEHGEETVTSPAPLRSALSPRTPNVAKTLIVASSKMQTRQCARGAGRVHVVLQQCRHGTAD